MTTPEDILFGGSDELRAAINAILPKYLEKRKMEVGAIEQAIQKQNYQALSVLGHQLKGHGPSYGFPQLGVIGAQIEEASKTKDTPRLLETLTSLKEFLSQY